MPIVADAAAAVRADLNPFIKDLKGADKHVDSLGARMKAALSPKALLGGLAAGFGASVVLDFLSDATQAASNMNETISKTGVILGQDALPGLEKWAEASADAFGLSKQAALDAASTFAVFGKSAGLAGDDLSGFSTDLTELAADLGSFYNTSPEDAILAIGAALRGESEPIRRYGVLLDDATLRQRAMKLGIIETTTQALTPQQRVLAAQAEIFAQTSDAQGDFGRTSDGLAGTQKILAAEMANLQVELGEKLLPVFLALAHFTKDVLVPALETLVTVAGAAGEALEWLTPWNKVIEAIIPNVKEVDKSMDEWLGDRSVWDAASADLEKVSGNADAAASHYMAMGESMADASEEVEVGAREMASVVETEWEKAHKAAVEDARALPGDLSQALIDGQADVESGMAALTDLMENSLSDAAKVAYYKGVLASEQLAAGLVDERADVRDAANKVKQDALDQLELLESGAADAAVDSGTTFAEQLRLQSAAAGRAAGAVAQKAQVEMKFNAYSGGTASAQTFINGIKATITARKSIQDIHLALNELRNRSLGGSLPTEGPFAHPETGAISIADRWLEYLGLRLRRGLLALQNPMAGLASWATPLLAPSMNPAAAGLATTPTSVVNNTWELHVGGVPYIFRTRDDFIKALDDVAGFGGG